MLLLFLYLHNELVLKDKTMVMLYKGNYSIEVHDSKEWRITELKTEGWRTKAPEPVKAVETVEADAPVPAVEVALPSDPKLTTRKAAKPVLAG